MRYKVSYAVVYKSINGFVAIHGLDNTKVQEHMINGDNELSLNLSVLKQEVYVLKAVRNGVEWITKK